MWTQTWIINGTMHPPRSITFEAIRAQLHPPVSYAYFCPKCGEVWARRIISPDTYWHVLTKECPKHPAPRYCDPEGSIWKNFDPDFIKHLPESVLKYEALLRINKDTPS